MLGALHDQTNNNSGMDLWNLQQNESADKSEGLHET